MIRSEIIAVGRLRKGAMLDIWQDYHKRISPSLILKEIEPKSPADEEKQLLSAIDPRAHLFAMDERGKNLSSKDFANKLEQLAMHGQSKVQFIIGGADGLPPSIRAKADNILSLGIQTWPHMLARIMLTEQIYRAQQIIAGHPYHRE